MVSSHERMSEREAALAQKVEDARHGTGDVRGRGM